MILTQNFKNFRSIKSFLKCLWEKKKSIAKNYFILGFLNLSSKSITFTAMMKYLIWHDICIIISHYIYISLNKTTRILIFNISKWLFYDLTLIDEVVSKILFGCGPFLFWTWPSVDVQCIGIITITQDVNVKIRLI